MLFVAPLLLANILSPHDYGALEVAYAAASIAALVLSLGTASLVPIVVLGHDTKGTFSSVLVHHLGIAGLCVSIAGLAWMQYDSQMGMLVGLCTAAVSFQTLWSTTLKTLGKSEASLLVDAGLWIVLVIAAFLSIGAQVPPDSRAAWVSISLAGYVVVLTALTTRRHYQMRPTVDRRTYLNTLSVSLPLLAVTLFTVVATTSGRLGIWLFSDQDMAAEYAVLFRATAVTIVAHQIIVVAKYRALFVLPLKEVQNQVTVIVALVATAALGFWVFSDVCAWIFGPAFVVSFERNRFETYIILAQCILWSAIALNDLVSTRAGAAGAVAGWSAIYFVLSLPVACLFLAANTVDVEIFVLTHGALMLGYFITQALAMRSVGIKFHRTWLFTTAAFVALSMLSYLVERR